jgi:hypothetical protein
MTVQINIARLEDQVLNPLNDILMLCYGKDVYKDVEKEIRRVVVALEEEHLFHRRMKR